MLSQVVILLQVDSAGGICDITMRNNSQNDTKNENDLPKEEVIKRRSHYKRFRKNSVCFVFLFVYAFVI